MNEEVLFELIISKTTSSKCETVLDIQQEL